MSEGWAFARLLRAGRWRGDAVRVYLDPDEGGRRAVADILHGGSDDEPFMSQVFFLPRAA